MSIPPIFRFFTNLFRREPAGGVTKPEAPPPPKMEKDTVVTTPTLRNQRFAGNAELAKVLTGKATLERGSKGEAVKLVQQALDDMAFVLPSGADGGYGQQSVQAVKNFQSMVGLPTTGIVDAKTLKALDHHAPPAGKKSWEPGANPGPVPDPDIGNGKKARVVVDISQHRLFLYDKNGEIEKIYGVRTGNSARGWDTKPGIKIVDGKLNDPTEIAKRLWGGTGDAFGTRLLNLSDYDPATGKTYLGKHKGQEIHGTYQEYSIGQDFSHGCVGMRNRDVEEVFGQVGNGEFIKFVQ